MLKGAIELVTAPPPLLRLHPSVSGAVAAKRMAAGVTSVRSVTSRHHFVSIAAPPPLRVRRCRSLVPAPLSSNTTSSPSNVDELSSAAATDKTGSAAAMVGAPLLVGISPPNATTETVVREVPLSSLLFFPFVTVQRLPRRLCSGGALSFITDYAFVLIKSSWELQ